MTQPKRADRHRHRTGNVRARGLSDADREAAHAVLAEHGWTMNAFLLAAIRFLPVNPTKYLQRLEEYRIPDPPRGRPKKSP